MCKEYMYENRVYINDSYVTFNIIELNKPAETVTVNISNSGHHDIETFELKSNCLMGNISVIAYTRHLYFSSISFRFASSSLSRAVCGFLGFSNARIFRKRRAI